jgi:CBS domain-containing protein
MIKSLGQTSATVTPHELRTERLRVLARRRTETIQAGSSVREAIRKMQAARGESLVVCRDDRPVGILTERDVLLKVLGLDVDLDGPLDPVMTADPDTIAADARVGEALGMMERGGYRNLPLVDDGGRLVGILRQQDVLEYVAEAFPQEILNLPPRPHQQLDEPEGA